MVIQNKQTFKVIFDNGKPFEETYKSEKELKKGLKDFYLRNKAEENDDFNAEVFNSDGEDISESQFIQAIIRDILNEE